MDKTLVSLRGIQFPFGKAELSTTRGKRGYQSSVPGSVRQSLICLCDVPAKMLLFCFYSPNFGRVPAECTTSIHP
jgi:hypothetical protein